jgi:trk system potassium uptake protein TrkA
LANRNRDARIVVIGLGRFGSSLAIELVRAGSEVLAIDSNPQLVQRFADELTHTAVADTTDEEALIQLGVREFPRAVVSIGGDIEASILTTSLLADFEIPHIWAKGVSRQHARILERVGAHRVVLPEYEMGERVAHLVTGRMLDYIEFEDDFTIVKTRAPEESVGKSLAESRLRKNHGVIVVGVKRPGAGFEHATPETVIRPGDILVVAGQQDAVESFANRN